MCNGIQKYGNIIAFESVPVWQYGKCTKIAISVNFTGTFPTLLFSGIKDTSISVHCRMAALLCQLTVCQNFLHWNSSS